MKTVWFVKDVVTDDMSLCANCPTLDVTLTVLNMSYDECVKTYFSDANVAEFLTVFRKFCPQGSQNFTVLSNNILNVQSDHLY